MTNEIHSGSSNPAGYYSAESAESAKDPIAGEQQQDIPVSSKEPLPEWQVQERERMIKLQARRALTQQELEKAVLAQDMKLFAEICSQRKDDIYFGLFIPVYRKAVYEAPLEFVRELEKFIVEQGERNLEIMLGEMDDPKAMKILVTSPLIKKEDICDSLEDYFQNSAIYGYYCDYAGRRKGELPHRLELAQILIDHGANPFNNAWGLAILNRDIEGLKMMMKHRDFNLEAQKIVYTSRRFFYKFEEKFDMEKLWGLESTVEIREAKSACTIFETLGLVPTPNELQLLIEKELELPFDQRKLLASILLPFIEEGSLGLSTENRTRLAMDFFRYYPHMGPFNFITYQKIVKSAVTTFLEGNCSPTIVAQRILTDAFKGETAIPDLPDRTEALTEEKDRAACEKEGYISHYCRSLVITGYAYHILVQNEKVRAELLRLKGGQEQLNKIETFHAKLLKMFGSVPWDASYLQDSDFTLLDIYRLAKENFTEERELRNPQIYDLARKVL